MLFLLYKMQNVGVHFETWNAGVLGPVTLKGLNSGTWDMSRWKWTYKVCYLSAFLLHFLYSFPFLFPLERIEPDLKIVGMYFVSRLV